MASLPLADVSALAAWVGQDIDLADPRAEAVLSAASTLVRAHTGQTWETATGAPLDVPEVVSVVTVQVAARVWNNPDGLTSVTVDDGTRRWGDGGGALRLTDADREALRPHKVGGNSSIGSLSVAAGSGSLDTIYVPTAPAPSGYPFPWYSTGA
jgi:hypothetical protein